MERLDKIIANRGIASRREVKELVRQGRVLVDGVPAAAPDMKISTETAAITVDGVPVCGERYLYLLLHKPAGVLTATEDKRQPTVLDLVPESCRRRGLAPVGRLDKDTEGLLLMTNDGPLAHHLLSPHHHVEKEYYVEHKLPLTDEDIYSIETGITFQSVTYRPAQYEKISDTSCHLTIREGKYHEIKMIFESLGDKVVYLKRLRMKNLRLDETLKPGQYRPLTDQEIEDLKEGMPR